MKPHEQWILKAEHDLLSSKKLVEGENPLLDTAIYHTQQCAEKILKAFLAFSQKPLVKTHDLNELVKLCSKIDTSFRELFDYVEQINPYYTAFKYPSDYMDPEFLDVTEAIDLAEKIFEFVKEKIRV
jgi:HEPN domain-containing protein